MIGEVQITRAPSNSISKSLFSFLNTIATIFIILSTIWSFVPTEPIQEPVKNDTRIVQNVSPLLESQQKINSKLETLVDNLNSTDKEKEETIENLKTKILGLEQKISKLEKLFLSST